jgi:glutamyl-tRNA synthetase
MGITHVIRGEDLIDSTHRVLALRHALVGSAATPDLQFAHLPLIVDAESRAKLSKRHGAVALEDFVTAGYLPEALTNYLALLGWAPVDDGHEVMSATELVAEFDLDRVTHAAAGFDRDKLDWLNGEWIRRIALDDLVARVRPMARERFGDAADADVIAAAVGIAQERAVTLVQIVDQMAFLFVDEEQFEIEPESWERVVATERIGEILDALAAHLETCEWTHDAVDFRGVLADLGLSKKQIRATMGSCYAVVEGISRGLPLFESIVLLGRPRTLLRIGRARERLG